MFSTGLTGDVGAGKSTLARVWRSLGATVIDSDAVAKAQWDDPDVMRAAVARWGEAVRAPDGRPIYAEIARRAFADEREYDLMLDLIMPGTRAELTRLLASARGWVVAEIPLLFENGWRDRIDCVVYAAAPIEMRAERSASRGLDAAEIARRESRLMPSSEKRLLSDEVLENAGSYDEWTALAREHGERFLRLAGIRETTLWCASEHEAHRIARALVDEALAPSAHVERASSVWRWAGETHCADEWRLTFAAPERTQRAARDLIRTMHSYELPAMTTTELCGADYATLCWIDDNCKNVL